MESKLSDQNNKLRNSLMLINESSQIGNDTLNQMKQNTDKLNKLNDKTNQINESANKSKSIIEKMSTFWRKL